VSNTKNFEELEYHPSLLMEVTKLVFSNVNTKEISQWIDGGGGAIGGGAFNSGSGGVGGSNKWGKEGKWILQVN